ncbi:MAG TPA: PQQ-dependent sugar dehydrogenase, partial [Flavisolibacter sp.]|nr:PQQ-dependent sugar dehydrogenase [Flavisolibacter sp.]
MPFQNKFKSNVFQGTFFYTLFILISTMLMMQLSSCKKNDMNHNNKAVDLKLVADGFVSPVSVSAPADGSHRLFVVDQIGKIWIIDNNGKKLPTPFLDVSSKMVTLMPGYDERGLLSIAFHPKFSTNGKFYVYYTAPPAAGGPQPGASWDNTSRISEFKVMAGNPNVADMSSERILLEENHP